MNTLIRGFLVVAVFAMGSSSTWADDYADTVALFKNAGQSASFFSNAYGYAVFPNIAKGGLGVGAAHGKGQVYVGGKHVGNTSMSQVSVGLQAGGQAFSEIIFFEDKKTFEEFSSGNFEFSADAGAVVITASASGSASTTGTSGTASTGKKDADTVGKYRKGTAIFTIAKGGLMYEATLAGQKFKYEPVAAK